MRQDSRDRTDRLRSIIARTLGRYMADRFSGRDGEAQLRRLRRLAREYESTNTNQTN